MVDTIANLFVYNLESTLLKKNSRLTIVIEKKIKQKNLFQF